MKKTPWFPPEIEPVRAGFYERDWDRAIFSATERLDYWDGNRWLYGVHSGAKVVPVSEPAKLRWRGLAREAK